MLSEKINGTENSHGKMDEVITFYNLNIFHF